MKIDKEKIDVFFLGDIPIKNQRNVDRIMENIGCNRRIKSVVRSNSMNE